MVKKVYCFTSIYGTPSAVTHRFILLLFLFMLTIYDVLELCEDELKLREWLNVMDVMDISSERLVLLSCRGLGRFVRSPGTRYSSRRGLGCLAYAGGSLPKLCHIYGITPNDGP